MHLLLSRRFLPLFLTQFFGALNDNMLKNALVILITYRIATASGDNPQILVTLAALLFILPYFLFSATAGQLADKIERTRLIRIIKLVEIGIMVFATIGFLLHSVWFLLAVLFAMGAHSTFFSPLKFALLPQHLHENELLLGNGFIEAGSFMGILLGTIFGGVLVLREGGEPIVSAALMAVAIAGYVASRAIPLAPAPEPSLRINRNIWRETWHIVGFVRADRGMYRCIMAISWFWLVGATFLSQFPSYVKDVLHAEASVVTLFLTVFSVGVGAGSLLCNRLLGGKIKNTFTPYAALGMAIFSIDLYFASAHTLPVTAELIALDVFLQNAGSLRILFDLLMIAVSAGIYIVPLYAIMQHDSPPEHRARIIACNNIINAIFMVAAAVFTLALLAMGCSVPQIFLLMGAANLAVAALVRRF